jgi:hypothetical protein
MQASTKTQMERIGSRPTKGPSYFKNGDVMLILRAGDLNDAIRTAIPEMASTVTAANIT